jgi:hypothetical protein
LSDTKAQLEVEQIKELQFLSKEEKEALNKYYLQLKFQLPNEDGTYTIPNWGLDLNLVLENH